MGAGASSGAHSRHESEVHDSPSSSDRDAKAGPSSSKKQNRKLSFDGRGVGAAVVGADYETRKKIHRQQLVFDDEDDVSPQIQEFSKDIYEAVSSLDVFDSILTSESGMRAFKAFLRDEYSDQVTPTVRPSDQLETAVGTLHITLSTLSSIPSPLSCAVRCCNFTSHATAPRYDTSRTITPGRLIARHTLMNHAHPPPTTSPDNITPAYYKRNRPGGSTCAPPKRCSSST